jgi:hypothetical protein
MCSFKGDQSWWGGRLACMADSLINHVIQIDSVRLERRVDSKNLNRAAKLYFEGT